MAYQIISDRALQVLLIVVFSLTSAACSSEVTSDADNIIGVWQIVELKDGGRLEDLVGDPQMTFRKDTLKFGFRERGREMEVEALYEIDAAKDPKWIDIKWMGVGPEGRHWRHGIYELKNDTLKIVLPEGVGVEEGERSTAFESNTGSVNEWFVTLERQRL